MAVFSPGDTCGPWIGPSQTSSMRGPPPRAWPYPPSTSSPADPSPVPWHRPPCVQTQADRAPVASLALLPVGSCSCRQWGRLIVVRQSRWQTWAELAEGRARRCPECRPLRRGPQHEEDPRPPQATFCSYLDLAHRRVQAATANSGRVGICCVRLPTPGTSFSGRT